MRIPLVSVSRRHCEINLAEEEVRVKDLASSNGTYVNNKRINDCPLSAGDRLIAWATTDGTGNDPEVEFAPRGTTGSMANAA